MDIDGMNVVEKKKEVKRRRVTPTSRLEGAKDALIWVRLKYGTIEDDNINKWLKLNISGSLLDKFKQQFDSSLSSDSCNDGVDRVIECDLDPKFNGPFDFPKLVPSTKRFCTMKVHCAPIGSVMYALGGDSSQFDINTSRRIGVDAMGLDIKNPGKYLPRPTILDPVTGGKPSDTRPPKNNNIYNTSHRFHFCDFSQPHLKWEISGHPLNTPRIFPKLVTMDGKLYVFGSYDPSDEEACFAEVYDPKIGYWVPLPKPPFGRLFDLELLVFPMPKYGKLLVFGRHSNIIYTFDTFTWYWRPFNSCPGLAVEFVYQSRRMTNALLSASNDVLYWIGSSVNLCAYNLLTAKFYSTPLSGIEDEQVLRVLMEDGFYPIVFLPLSNNLFGLIWSTSFMDVDCVDSSYLHINFLHLNTNIDTGSDSDNKIEPFLAATVGKCLTYSFKNEHVNMIDAYLMDTDEGNR